jgi:hypothetical protein
MSCYKKEGQLVTVLRAVAMPASRCRPLTLLQRAPCADSRSTVECKTWRA